MDTDDYDDDDEEEEEEVLDGDAAGDDDDDDDDDAAADDDGDFIWPQLARALRTRGCDNKRRTSARTTRMRATRPCASGCNVFFFSWTRAPRCK